MWSEKYRPKEVSEMVGNEEARAAVVEWFAKWKPGTRPLLLVGPPGTGKTTMAFLAAKQFGYDMIGLNASDARSKTRINELLRPVLGNVSVMGSPMIFVDEVDGIHGRGDYGGASALVDILKEPSIPMVLAANDDSSDKMKAIKKAARTVPFKRVPPRLLMMHLKGILEAEGAKMGPGSLVKTVRRSRGDIRSMINLAQSMITGYSPETEGASGSVGAEEGVAAFFRAGSEKEARGILYSMRMDPREKIGLFYSSVITSGLDPKVLARYMGALSEADMLYGRIMRTQNWRLLRYLNDALMGMHGAGGRVKYSQYNLPWPLLNRIRWDGSKIRSMSAALGKRLHLSSSAFVTLCLPYMLACVRNGALEPDEDHEEVVRKEVGLLR